MVMCFPFSDGKIAWQQPTSLLWFSFILYISVPFLLCIIIIFFLLCRTFLSSLSKPVIFFRFLLSSPFLCQCLMCFLSARLFCCGCPCLSSCLKKQNETFLSPPPAFTHPSLSFHLCLHQSLLPSPFSLPPVTWPLFLLLTCPVLIFHFVFSLSLIWHPSFFSSTPSLSFLHLHPSLYIPTVHPSPSILSLPSPLPPSLLSLFCLHSHCIHQILESVHHIHQHDIVHRDLKVSKSREASASLTLLTSPSPPSFCLLPSFLFSFLPPQSRQFVVSFLSVTGLMSACPTCLLVCCLRFAVLLRRVLNFNWRTLAYLTHPPWSICPPLSFQPFFFFSFYSAHITKAPVALTDSQIY